MTSVFGARATADEVLSGHSLAGKRALITGVSAGIGVETARALAARGAEVVGAVRHLDKAKRVIDGIAELRISGRFELIQLDLASLENVRHRAKDLISERRPFDIVIANADVMATPYGRTTDGFETQFGTNHLGHFTFINCIAPLIADGGRLINVASSGHRIADVDLDDPNFEHMPYDPWIAYGRSKTANILFAVEFDRRHRHRGVRAAAVHPGGVRTELSRHIGDDAYKALIDKINANLAAEGMPPYELKTLAQGAATSVWAAAVADADVVGGAYCENCHVSAVVDGPIGPASEGVRAYALDPARAKALWAKSEQMIRQRFLP